MLDFGALPPEVNSGRLYAGPGSGPIMAASSAWQAVASQLDGVAQGYGAVVSGLLGEAWAGGASAAMAAAATPYVEWIAAAAAQAEETAMQARAAAAAYESAFAATVPPALVAANRAHYTALVMANIFGQYTAQIAADEAAYAEMWAQDAQAMYAYAGSSSAATSLTPFTRPPETTTATGQSAQSAAVAQAAGNSGATQAQSSLSRLMAAVPQQLQNFAAAAPAAAPADPLADPVLTAFSNFNTLSGPTNLTAALSRTATSAGSFFTALYRTGIQAEDLPKIAEEGAGAAGAANAARAGAQGLGAAEQSVLASVGQAEPIGGLSVPQTWASATPIASAVETPQWLSEADLGAVPASSEMAGAPGAAPMLGMAQQPGMWSRPTVSNILRVPTGRFKMPRPFQGG
ncbi:PPE family protein [Mycobacterium sp.]|uniref:PPE family protein n=1 Tax=Mycobacterium sp. TaxID=1785 RepID=UPI0025F37760|nr:PPE family protein [Mycobacterium sp.]